MSRNRTWDIGKAMSGRPDINLKGTARAKSRPPFFAEDEKFGARAIADHVRCGGTLRGEMVAARVRQCIEHLKLLPDDRLQSAGLCLKSKQG